MKKLTSLLIVAIFTLGILGGCASNTMRGAGVGAGAGGIASIIAGKSGSTAALLIMGGALLGGLVGNTMDEQAKAASLQPSNKGKQVMIVEEGPAYAQQRGNATTSCHKVTKKTWVDGNRTSETTEEVCTGDRTSHVYE